MERFDYPVLLKAAEKDVRGRIIFLITNFFGGCPGTRKTASSRCKPVP